MPFVRIRFNERRLPTGAVVRLIEASYRYGAIVILRAACVHLAGERHVPHARRVAQWLLRLARAPAGTQDGFSPAAKSNETETMVGADGVP